MTQSSLSIPLHVLEAVQAVWTDAGREGPVAGIVPLFDLVASYPIWVYEVEYLTIERAANYLTEKTGQKPDMGLDSRGPLSGFFYANLYREHFVGCILTEKRDPVVRRRFSVAHELGHYKMHFEPWLAKLTTNQAEEGVLITDAMIYADQTEGASGFTAGTGNALPIHTGVVTQQPEIILSDAQEIEANQFAASLLMPEQILRERIAEFKLPVGQPRGYLASRLASEFLVSKEAMAYRLTALEL